MSMTTVQGPGKPAPSTDETGGIPPAAKAAAKAAATRRRHKALAAAGPYGALLGELCGAQQASDRAKSRPANGKRRRDFGRYQGAESNYRASRAARLRDYREKERHLAQACVLLAGNDLSVEWGWQVEPDR